MAKISLDNEWSARYHARASSLRDSAGRLLSIIVSLLMTGAVVFVFASYITDFDRSKSQDSPLADRIARTRAALNKEVESSAIRAKATMADNIAMIRNLVSALERNKIGQRVDAVTATSLPIRKIIQYSVGNHVSPASLVADMRQGFEGGPYNPAGDRALRLDVDENTKIVFSLSLADQKRAIEAAATLPQSAEAIKSWSARDEEEKEGINTQQHDNQLLQGLLARQLEEEINNDKNVKIDKKEISTSNLIQTSITRVGAVATISFLVAILVPLYRYNIRLAAFYTSIGDVLAMTEMENSKANNFEDLVRLLTPSFDFGRSPKTPVETAAELAKLLSERASK